MSNVKDKLSANIRAVKAKQEPAAVDVTTWSITTDRPGWLLKQLQGR